MAEDLDLNVKVLGMVDKVDDLRLELVDKHINCATVDLRLSVIQKLPLDSKLTHL